MAEDRSVGLAELAARTQAGPQGARRRTHSDCRNPECQNGLTPGLVAAGGGSKAQPLFGAGGVGAKRLMRWGWVPCVACSPTDDQRKAGARYKDLRLSETQIAQRAELASRKAAYQPQERVMPNRPTSLSPGSATHSADVGQLTELIEANKKLNDRLAEVLTQNTTITDTLARMSMQVAALLEDNAKLREQVAKSVPIPESLVKACQEPRPTLTLPKKDTP